MAGNSVGRMYVDVIADTSRMKDQIERDAKAAGKKAGKDARKAFDENWRKKSEKSVNRLFAEKAIKSEVRRVTDSLVKSVDRNKLGEAFKPTLNWDAEFGEQIAKIAETYKITMNEAADIVAKYQTQAIEESIRESEKALKKSEQETDARAAKRAKDALKRQRDADNEARAAARRLAKDLSTIIGDDTFEAAFKNLKNLLDNTLTKEMRKALRNGQKVDWTLHKDFMIESEKMADAFGKDVDRMRFYLQQRLTPAFTSGGDSVDWFDVRMRRMSLSLRRAGTGGWFDSLTNAIALMVRGLGSLARALRTVLGTAGKAFTAVGKSIGTLTKNVGGLTKVFKPVGAIFRVAGSVLKWFAKNPIGLAITVIGALTIGLKVLGNLLGALVSAVSAAAGIITLLASAAYLAAANIVPLVGVLGGVATGLLATVVAAKPAMGALKGYFKVVNADNAKARKAAQKEYNEELKKLGPITRSAVKAMEPLIDTFKGVQKQMSEKFFTGMEKAFKNATPMADGLRKGMVSISEAAGDAAESFLNLGKDKTFVKDLETTLEGFGQVIRDVGSAFADVFAGVFAMFSTLTPTVKEFSGGIKDIGANFKEWAQSEQGRQSVLDFFTRAKEVGKQVWDILSSLGGAIHNLMFGASDSGASGKSPLESFLGRIKTKMDELKVWIDEQRANGNLNKWFEEAEQFARDLWTMIDDVFRALKSLNTEEAKAWMGAITRGIGDIIVGFVNVFNGANNLFQMFRDPKQFTKITAALLTGNDEALRNAGWKHFVSWEGGFKAGMAESTVPEYDIPKYLKRPEPQFPGIGKSAGTSWVTGFGDGVSGGLTLPSTLNESLPPDLLTQNGKDISAGLIDGMKQGAGDLPTFGPTYVADPFAKSMGIKSPSTVFYGFGASIMQGLLNGLKSLATTIDGVWTTLKTTATTTMESIKTALGKIDDNLSFSGIATALGSAMSTAYDTVSGWATTIGSKIRGLLDRARSAGSTIGGRLGFAAGGLVTAPTRALIGEAGPEAVVPLTRPLSQVNADVRGMAALLRGQYEYKSSSGVGGPSKVVNASITVESPAANPAVVAEQVVNRLVAIRS